MGKNLNYVLPASNLISHNNQQTIYNGKNSVDSRPENEPNPVDLASFEEIFESRGAKRCWQPGRLTSPLALHYAFPANYERFCSAKTKLDKNLLLDSGYLQGTILSAAIKKR